MSSIPGACLFSVAVAILAGVQVFASRLPETGHALASFWRRRSCLGSGALFTSPAGGDDTNAGAQTGLDSRNRRQCVAFIQGAPPGRRGGGLVIAGIGTAIPILVASLRAMSSSSRPDWWRSREGADCLPARSFASAIRAGVRMPRTIPIWAPAVRVLASLLSPAPIWRLLPLRARPREV